MCAQEAKKNTLLSVPPQQPISTRSSGIRSKNADADAELHMLRSAVMMHIHDARNCCGSLVANCELLSHGGYPPSEIAEIAHDLTEVSHHLVDLTHQLERLTLHTYRPLVSLDLSAFVHARMRLFESLAQGASVRCMLGQSIPRIRVDETDLVRILANLIHNSVAAIPSVRDGIIRITTGTIFCDATYLERFERVSGCLAEGIYAEVSVSDNGSGFDESLFADVFSRRVSTKTHGGGTGLLFISETLSYYGGAIAIESTPSIGTIVRIFIPEQSEIDTS